MPPTCIPYSLSNGIRRLRPRPEALDSSTSQSPISRPTGWWRTAGDGGRHEAVRGALEQGHLLAGLHAQGVGVPVAPVLVHERSVEEVPDPGTAAAQEARERARLRERVQRRAGHVHSLGQRRSQVRGAERDHVPHLADPAHPIAARPVSRRCARRDRPSNDRRARSRPPRQATLHQLLEQLRERGAVLGDVPAAVVAQVHGRAPEVASQPRSVGLATLDEEPSRQANSVSIRPWRKTTRRGLASGNAAASAGCSRSTGRPSTRTHMGPQSSLPSASSASPRRPCTTPIARLPRGEVESVRPVAERRRPSATSTPRPSSADAPSRPA